jgi:hypothetical protein
MRSFQEFGCHSTEDALSDGHRVSARQIAGPIEGTCDVTDQIRDALDDFG